MLPIVSILVIVGLSLLVTRIASVALVHTGLGREAARFQARSAFTGVGFTTSESETIKVYRSSGNAAANDRTMVPNAGSPAVGGFGSGIHCTLWMAMTPL